MRYKTLRIIFFICLSLVYTTLNAQKIYKIWDSQPGRNAAMDSVKAKGGGAKDADWEAESYPLGNGYMGANVFGRTDIERIQITEKTLCTEGKYDLGGITSFADVFIDFNHHHPQNYSRVLNLNDAILYVDYEYDGVRFTREYFINYPDNVMVVKLSANKKGKVSFTLRPQASFVRDSKATYPRTAKSSAQGNLITLSGTIPFFSENYEAQFKVVHDGGILTASNKGDAGEIKVKNANSVVLIIAAGTNYELSKRLFLEKKHGKKLDITKYPHQKITNLIQKATSKGFSVLKKNHLSDYQQLFSRVKLNITNETPSITTRTLLNNYINGITSPYLEELMYQFGRYLLIASSRKGTLPSGLQGVWTAYELTPWTGGYWHNINIQMNYWGAFNSNLAETFIPYIEYYNAYLPKAKEIATTYLQSLNYQVSDTADNGWIIGTGASPFVIGTPGGHSGPGTGGMTAKMFWEYYDFTRDLTFLKNIGYPCLLGASKFLSKTLQPDSLGVLLVQHSASPEQAISKGKYYLTKGTTYDQAYVWENHTDLLKAAAIVGSDDPFLKIAAYQVDKLDPILVGESGQIKEFREEKKYGEIGEPNHRHISHLCALYPGTLINSHTKEWMKAAITTLDLRGNKTTGWAMAHRMNARARTKDGEKAYEVYSKFIKEKTLPNLWTVHPPFQIDGNFGCMAGVAEMLLQSHEGCIEILPALPKVWKNGEYSGLVARGNFEVAVKWKDGKANLIQIIAKSGGECVVKYPNLAKATILNAKGVRISYKKSGDDIIRFETTKGGRYKMEIK